MNDPMSAYEQCPYCGEYTDGSCCLVNFDLIDKMIDEIDTYLTWHGLDCTSTGAFDEDTKTGYEKVPDALMGFGKATNKGFSETKYPYELDVYLSFDNGETWVDDGIKGMNPLHALERARRNWPDAIVRHFSTSIINRQRTALTNAANSLSIFRSITHRPNH